MGEGGIKNLEKLPTLFMDASTFEPRSESVWEICGQHRVADILAYVIIVIDAGLKNFSVLFLICLDSIKL